eukprot:s6187_g1.t1
MRQVLQDKDEPDIQEAARLGALTRSVSESPAVSRENSAISAFTKKTCAGEEWHNLPVGSWAWPQVAMYQILIDRFATPHPQHCEKLNEYCGGNLPGLMERVNYLEELGVDGIVLSPVMPHGYHGYWTKDLTKVNPAYGTEEDVRQLVILLHERRMKVNASNPRDVSILKPFNKPEHYHSDNCRRKLRLLVMDPSDCLIHDADYERGSYFLEHCKLYGLPDFNHENPIVWQGLMQWVRDHVDKYGFDGIRVDAARHINRRNPRAVFTNFLNHIPETGPPIPAYYEVVNTDMAYVAGYATGDYGADIFVPGPKQKPMSALGDWMEKQLPKAQGRLMLNFLDNNDLPRFLYRIGEGGGIAEATMMAFGSPWALLWKDLGIR